MARVLQPCRQMLHLPWLPLFVQRFTMPLPDEVSAATPSDDDVVSTVDSFSSGK
jgi:hypothetical protein